VQAMTGWDEMFYDAAGGVVFLWIANPASVFISANSYLYM
jgi:hypothetical protein